MSKRVLFAVGGTGGHLFPAQALARELSHSKIDLLFAGHGLTANHYFQQALFSFEEIPSGTPRKGVRSFCRIGEGIYKSSKLFKEFKPDLVIGFGSFHSFPLLLTARMRGIPYFLCESNAIPGQVNRLFAGKAKGIAIQFEEVNRFLKTQGTLVPVPIWCKEGSLTREEARLHYGLDPNRRTLLIFGGSQGAEVLNLSTPKMDGSFQVIHFTGKQVEEIRTLYAQRGISAYVSAFESQMERAYLAADLAICRAGGATLAELIAFELPALLIPWPGAADNHQEANARAFTERIGGGKWLSQKELSADKLSMQIGEMDLTIFRQNLRIHKQQIQKKSLAEWILEF